MNITGIFKNPVTMTHIFRSTDAYCNHVHSFVEVSPAGASVYVGHISSSWIFLLYKKHFYMKTDPIYGPLS